jgi:NADPH:quinone reductase
MKAVVADPIGGPENLKLIDVPKPQLAAGDVLVKLAFSGVNFIDVYYRSGLYKAPETPVRLGSEGAGIVAESGGSSFQPGQRVAYVMARGSYAEYAAVPARNMVAVPDHVSLQDAAAVLLQGMTAHYLTRSTFPLKPEDTCLVHAAAGGTGSLVVQLARLAGATVIGTVGSADKATLAQRLGAQHIINYNETDFVAEARRITKGKGVAVVFDSVGAATFRKSLDCLRPRGMMVSFGNASGPVEPISPLLLSEKGSLFLTRPSLASYISDAEEFQWRTTDLFGWLNEGKLHLKIHRVYPLAEAATAHRDLEGRTTSGKLLLNIQ